MIHGTCTYNMTTSFGYLLEAEKNLSKLQEMHCSLSNRITVNILFRGVTVVPTCTCMCTTIQSDLDLHVHTKSQVNQETA